MGAREINAIMRDAEFVGLTLYDFIGEFGPGYCLK